MRASSAILLALAVVTAILPIATLHAEASDVDTLVGRWQGQNEYLGGHITLYYNSDGTGRGIWEETDGEGYEEVAFTWRIVSGYYYQANAGELEYAYEYDLNGDDLFYHGKYGMWFERYGNDDFLGGLNCCCCLGFIGAPVAMLTFLGSLGISKYR